ncbi:MAG: tryptophan 7-halogenase [Gammaproteobacteria bacterium]|nr:tryptophan 7-halogenase [Gammaproteobacteria bacterium]
MNNQDSLSHVIVVGGGTAGWITAGILAKRFDCANNQSMRVSLVESPNIPILGVGEGTWPTIRNTLQSLGISETEFIRNCDGTFKQGSEFVNWVHTPKDGEKSSYYHPLNSVYHSAYDFNLAAYWLLQDSENRQSYDFATASQAHICSVFKAPKKITTPEFSALQNYSYHLDANKFARFMHEHCVNKLGVEYISADVLRANIDNDGYISSLQTEQVGTISGDFFVDCTGSRALLLGETLGVAYQSIKDVIFNDRAIATHVPYENDDSPIASNTIATAHQNGWTWDIGLSERRGVGIVYSADHTSEAEAELTLKSYIGAQADSLSYRGLQFESGYREKFWKKNCVAIGMSAAFIEPLEASAIFLVEAAANMLAEQFPSTRDDLKYVSEQYNDIFRLRWDKTVDFVKLHYCITKRRDSDYWIDNCAVNSIPESLQDKLKHWQSHLPSKYDFDYAFEPFVLDSYLFVLYGMQFQTKVKYISNRLTEWEKAKYMFDQVQSVANKLNQELPTHRQLLNQVKEYGFSTI